jgi:hypothetical protein
VVGDDLQVHRVVGVPGEGFGVREVGDQRGVRVALAQPCVRPTAKAVIPPTSPGSRRSASTVAARVASSASSLQVKSTTWRSMAASLSASASPRPAGLRTGRFPPGR